MEASKNKIKKIGIFFSGTREELNKIETKFQWLKMNFGLKKMELYKKALLWIATDEKAKQKFIEYLMTEKAKTQIIGIKE